MRSRNIKPSFFDNEHLAELDPLTRLLFIGLWCFADREGRFEWRPKRIKAKIFPYDDLDITSHLMSLHDITFIYKYSINGKDFGFIPNFTKHQTPHPHEKQSVIPPPLVDVITCHDKSLNDTKCQSDILIPDIMNPDTRSSPEPEKSDSGPPAVLKIPLIKKDGEFSIFQNDISEWQNSFPGVDVPIALKHIRQYNVDNPINRKTKNGIRKHITTWLAKAQDKKQYPRGSPSSSKSIQKETSISKCKECGEPKGFLDLETGLCKTCFGASAMPDEFKEAVGNAFKDIPDGADLEKRKEVLKAQAQGLTPEDDIPYD